MVRHPTPFSFFSWLSGGFHLTHSSLKTLAGDLKTDSPDTFLPQDTAGDIRATPSHKNARVERAPGVREALRWLRGAEHGLKR